MISTDGMFSGFSVRDVAEAREFYAALGVTVGEEMGALTLDIGGGKHVFVYEKPNHEPATYTVLNFDVPDIDAAVAELEASGIQLIRYEGFDQDEHGIARGSAGQGPDIGWFTDPSGNILSVLATPAER
ncbi:MAG: VOC family protein [Leifsonia sp.]